MSEGLYAKIHKIAQGYTVLYVEDDEEIANVMGNILTLFCKTLYRASNGEEGYECYLTCKPDIIITDISMPKMNGIEMVKKIREQDKQIPIMINSAFSDQNYLLDSIYLGVSRYTVKPIRQEEFLESLYALFEILHRRDEAALYEKIKLQERINQASTKMVQTMMEVYPFPTLVYTEDGRLYGLNRSATELFDINSHTDENKNQRIHAFFSKEEGYTHDLESLEEGVVNSGKVKVRTSKGVKIFMVIKKAIEAQEFGKLFVLAFTDITRLEYEKQKSQNLSMFFREMLYFRQKNLASSTPFKPKKEPFVQVPANVTEPARELSYEEIRLQAMHYSEKTSAKSYVEEIDEGVVEELAEMDELEKEMHEALLVLNEEPSLDLILSIASRLERYARTIGSLITFEDLAFSLDKLSKLLANLASMPEKSYKLHLLLDGVVSDLILWRKMIFVSQEASDIHYLDASLLSSCLQIETEFFGGKIENEEELDLF